MKNNYHPDEARKILEGTLEERAINYAEIKYGKGEEVKAKLYRGGYRNSAVEPVDVLDQVCGGKEVVEPEAVESIDDVVGYQKPSMLKVAANGTVNLAKKAHLHQWYYPLVGMLPAKYQGKIAEKLGDTPLHYTVSNAIAEGVAAGGVAGYLIYQHNPETIGLALSMGGLMGVIIGLINLLVRGVISQETKGNVKAAGSIVFLPLYATLYSIAAVKAIKNTVVNAYSSAFQEERQKLLQAGKGGIFPVRPIPSPPPAPAEAPPRIETQARIEEPTEIVEDEFRDELADFDRRLRERNGL